MLEKIKEHSKLVTTGACLLIAAVAVSYKLTKQGESGVEKDYFLAHLNLQKLKGGDEEKLTALTRILKKRPTFRSAFAPAIAQHLIDHKRVKEAKTYLKAQNRNEKSEVPLHKRFSRTSLMMAGGDLVLALAEAKGLQKDLSELKGEKSAMLSAFNILRVALLENKVGTKDGELKAWEQIEALDDSLTNSLHEVFHVNEVTLNDYIKHRKSTLAL